MNFNIIEEDYILYDKLELFAKLYNNCDYNVKNIRDALNITIN